MSDRIVGIDLGTSNSVVAFVDELDRVRSIPDAEGATVHPSVVSFHPNGGVVVGILGKQRKVIDPQNTIYSAKRMIGQPFNSAAVRETRRRVPFEIKEGANELPMIVTRSGEFAIPEISAIVLDHMKKIASQHLEQEIGRAVVTVPASFTDVQRSSTATAGALAGLTVVRVLNEPTAAALAYGSTKKLDEVIAVYDFGGGTFDITILQLQDQVYTVLGTSGDAFLGGEDIDERLVERMTKQFLEQHRIDLHTDPIAMMRLRAVAEHTKIELSRRSRAIVKIEHIAVGKKAAPLDLEMQFTRDELIPAIGDLVSRTFASCKEAMVVAGVKPSQISDVILVGGTTRIPHVREQVAAFFAMAPRADVNPDDAIATGAALQASSIEQMLTRAPVRGGASIQVPLEEAEDTDIVVEIESEARVRPIESKAPQNVDAATISNRAKEFFGDLFGDKAQPTRVEKLEPEPARQVRARSEPSVIITLDQEAETKPAVRPARARSEPSMIVSSPEIEELDLDIAEELTDAEALQLDPSMPSIDIRTDDFAVDEPRVDAAVKLGPRKSLELDWEEPVGWSPSVEPIPPTRTAIGRAVAEPMPRPITAPVEPPRAPATIIDVTPRGLGIATMAGFCEELIRRNTQLPANARKTFTTNRDLQDTVRIVVCQGESRRLDNNILIGDLVLPNLPPRPRGDTKIDVEFVLDASGILHVTARDTATGKEQRARLDLKGGMPQADLAVAQKRLQDLARKS